jgi:tRNA A-37 threonylcarbamoyl transferase component Bud32
MTPERWQQVSQLVDAALARPDSQRASFLKDACGNDASLRHEVLSLLAMQDGAAGFLERPAPEVAAHASALDRAAPRDRVQRSPVAWAMYLGVASFVGYFALVVFSVYYRPLDMGMTVEMGQSDRLFVSHVTPDSDAGHADVRARDLVVAVNGHQLRTPRDYRAFTASARVDESQTYVFDRSGRQFVVAITPRRIPRSSRLPFVPGYIARFVSLALSLVVIYKRPEDPVARLGAVSLASLACIGAPDWPVGLAGTWRHLPLPLGALLWPACLSAFAVGPIMFALFARFPRAVIRRRWVWVASLTPGALVTVWAAAYLMLAVYRPERSADLLRDWFTSVAPLSLPAYFAAGIAILVASHFQSADLNERRRIRVLLLGMSAAGFGLLFGAVGIVLRERGSHSMFADPAPSLICVLLIALPSAFAYAIIAQRLFDIRILVRLGLRYALARRSILVLAPALLAGIVVDLLLHGDRPLVEILWQRGWAYLTLVGVAAAAFWYRTGWLASIDRRFFRERYDAQPIFTQIIQDVRTVGQLDAVAARTVSRMRVAFHSSFVALMVREPDRDDFEALSVTPETNRAPHLTKDSTVVGLVRVIGKPVDFANAPDWLVDHLSDDDFVALHADGIELVAPIVTSTTDRREAMLVFGPKRSEEPYSREDRELVASIADSLAMLVQPPSVEADAEQGFAECPQCGSCDSTGATRCAEDGSPLVPVALSRVLGGRYTIQRRLGLGGMGAVYQARDVTLERLVAVKVIRDEMLASPDAADRFRREALLAASFTHPNVVTVHDFGIADRRRGYLVMELLSGATLREALRQGRWSASRTLQVMRGVCLAVDEAHRRQLIHRDLKPENIFLVRDDVPKVLDFGIAKSVVVGSAATFHTATNVAIGTLDYMSPEQRRGGIAAPSWDVWALAVIACEMLTGETPSSDGLRLGTQPSGLSGSMHATFARAFAVEPAERPFGALALLDDLQHALAE